MSSLSPVDWWHQLEGGTIAQSRPPPPNADAPYPNLGTVPAKPAPIDPATRTRIANALVADRANAQYGASLVPLSGPAPSVAPPPPAQPSEMNASLPAASAAPPRPAPVANVQSAPLPSPKPPSAPASADAAPMPVVPAGPPPPPSIAGASVPAVTAPTPPAPTPPPPPAPPPVRPGAPLAVAFAPGSAQVSFAAQKALQQFAAQRAGAAIAVTGYGDASSTDPADQSAALPLAWQRAQAIAGTLQTDGVPIAFLRLSAEATGHGGAAAIAP